MCRNMTMANSQENPRFICFKHLYSHIPPTCQAFSRLFSVRFLMPVLIARQFYVVMNMVWKSKAYCNCGGKDFQAIIALSILLSG